ncbi:MAG: alkaline shock response membrane anchor protein AmaP [Acidaminococcaceae bacterium]|nr:alkaline shock response membrane anchor protein AmaP [Acidaminococcaceae bacterium]
MGITDRIILTLYTFLMAVVAILLILGSLGVIPQDATLAFIATIPGSWEYALIGIILLGVSVRLLLAGIGALGVNTLTLSEEEGGKLLVSKRALEDYIGDIAQEVYGIYGVKVVVKMADKAVDARINASLEPGVNVYEVTHEVKTNIKETIKKVLGMEVGDIELFFKQIKETKQGKA